jgi:NAD(P)-dependent dehydrogenase (short-subunit alcohol dehydrogenase family)
VGFAASARAYAASKLCNILTARSLAALADVRNRDIAVIAYNPGLTVGTSLGGSRNWAIQTLIRPVLYIVSPFKSAFYPGTPARAGEALAQLALGTVSLPPGRIYASLVRGRMTFPDPAPLARSDEARDRLWRESAPMVGLPA